MFNRLRRRTGDMRTIKHLLADAENVAREQGADKPGAEHLVIAALALPDGTARRAFERIGADPDAFGTAVTEQHAEALRDIGIDHDDAALSAQLPEPQPAGGVYRSEVSMQQLFQRVTDDVKSDGSSLVGAHVIRAAARMEYGTTARALDHMGIDRMDLAQAAGAEIAGRHADAS
ncbi:Clp protease N-terminal domain-containing protein [Phytoactinopolyspora halotolerans]|uniref:Clp R domain-containing protein n=1 Tax=Phytoactinopolyspora halotolerans TaxID=1981512 RepID=A0A6L9SCN3_9ACTN|nr:Clp protease N-terminal domain-containing protein [Phytoactinopolyspora halotolerans]NEE02986.1 hypothetical protein [Phytoactinopolyspora halotolerans]